MKLTAKEAERISKALGDPNRLKILHDVKQREWMQCADICENINLAQPSVSHHIKQLTDAGLLIAEKEGRNIRYTIDKKVITAYTDYINTLKI